MPIRLVHYFIGLPRAVVVAICGLWVGGMSLPLVAAEPGEGYLPHASFITRVQELGTKYPAVAKVASLGKSDEGRDLWLITLSQGEEKKPAFAVIGSVQPANLMAAEVTLRMAEQIAAAGEKDEKIKRLLKHYTLYIIPRPEPDGSEKAFRKPLREPLGNARRTDDDRDFQFGEDPPDDLNGDGIITLMRVADETGNLRAHPNDPRVLIPIDPKKDEKGQYRIFPEGKDDDGDEAFNEDASDGVNLNSNFTFRYPAFQAQAGANAVSEVESRVLADFLFDHDNIAAVLTITSEDNLFHPWKHDAAKDKGRNRGSVTAADAGVFESLAEPFRKLHGGKDCPASPAGRGSFSEWAYFHYGRWSFASRGWWIPKVEPEKKEAEKGEDKEKPKDKPEKPADDSRGSEAVNALRWFAQQDINGFVPWQEVAHPQFPGKKVEVGGFKPFAQTQPPAAELPKIAEKQVEFLTVIAEKIPELVVTETKVEALGGGTFRLSATVLNRGGLPTQPEIAEITGQPGLQIELTAPKDAAWLIGHPRSKLPRLEARTGKVEKQWLVRFPEKVPETIKIRVWGPTVFEVQHEFRLVK